MNLANEVLKEFIGQFLALLAFFAFPAFQYVLLRRFTKNEGAPELWFIPAYGFRLVIRNIPGKRIFSELKTRALIRAVIPSRDGASVSTFKDEILVAKDDFFLFPGTDQTLVSFRLERECSESIVFVFTDKLGEERKRFSLNSFDKVVCDYSANLENLLNFDIKMAKRAELSTARLAEIFKEITAHHVEQRFNIDRVRDIH